MRWVVTGANRGIGLEFVRQLAARGDHVEALARKPDASPELVKLAEGASGRVRTFACDVSDDASVRAAAQAIGEVAVDGVLNNAGVMGRMMSLEELDLEDAAKTFDANAFGAIRVTRALLPHLRRAKTRKVVSLTSGMGSIGENTRGGAYGYRMSKAALNMATKSMSIDFKDEGFSFAVINPGWVATDMGGGGAPTPVTESVSLMLKAIDELTPAQTGSFLNYRGGTMPW